MNSFEFLHYPYTHSLLMGVVWGTVIAGIYWLLKKDIRGAIVVGLCVLSHWFFDLVVHVADLPLTPFTNIKVGFGLWNHVMVTLIVETIIFATGIYIYLTITKAKNNTGKWALWTLIALLFIFNLANTFGPPPPDSIMTLFISFVITMSLIVSLAYWVDRNREVVNG